MGRSTDLYRFLDTVGDGTGDSNANGNYATIPKNFMYTCPADVRYVTINRLIIYIEDTGNFSADGYGALSGLTNGIQVRVEHAGETILLTNNKPVKTNLHWGQMCYDTSYISFGSGDNGLTVRWTFGNSGKPIKLYPGESLIVLVRDNLSGLVDHTFFAQGQITW